MKKLLRSIYYLLVTFGLDPLRTIASLKRVPFYIVDFIELKKQKTSAIDQFPFGKPRLCLNDKFEENGIGRDHYFHQDLLVARRIYLHNPRVHVDVGSSIAGFVAHVASFRKIEVFDIRPMSNTVPNIRFVQADMMNPPKDKLVEYCDSLSCLHAIEHFGLGRYGDPVNYDGHLVGINNLHRILQRGGKFYLSAPIGRQCIEFNAHRIFSIEYLLKCFEGKYKIDRFSFVDDSGALHEDITMTDDDIRNNCGCAYGCGIFEMTKI